MPEKIDFDKLDALLIRASSADEYKFEHVPSHASDEEIAECVPESARPLFLKVAKKLNSFAINGNNYILQTCRLYDNPLEALKVFDLNTPGPMNRTFGYDFEAFYFAELGRLRNRKAKGISNKPEYLACVLEAITDSAHEKIDYSNHGRKALEIKPSDPGNSWDNTVRTMEC
jgi:hypothetical protein